MWRNDDADVQQRYRGTEHHIAVTSKPHARRGSALLTIFADVVSWLVSFLFQRGHRDISRVAYRVWVPRTRGDAAAANGGTRYMKRHVQSWAPH